MDIKGSEILITGGAGFIGSNLAEELVKRRAHVTIIDAMIWPYGGNDFNLKNIKTKIKFIKGDIRSKELMKKLIEGKDYIFHLAAQTGRLISIENPRLDIDINLNGTLSILEAITSKNRKAKLIYASSRGVIGAPLYLPVDENHPTNPKDLYGVNKLKAEQHCFDYGGRYNFGVTSLRFNNVYGPKCQVKSNHYGTLNLFIRYALEGKILPVYGKGTQTRDYVYISDVVDALIKAMDKKSNGEFFMVGSGKEYSLLEIVDLIRKEIKNTRYRLVNYPPNLEEVDFPRFVSSFRKINKLLGWKPKVMLDQGIEKTVLWYKKYLKYYV